ncbi:glycine betaine ABC transporter substrate-binding protein [Natranaerobius trueperi]|uniref:Glycine/betaine ABC transporter n=1 Tax=Natranaerobius trueperi TaxID=759412 RepID=A0A226C0A1_9FIRM|nr:glycine betaine ABC transporter substrate-binding protein [Natranaerobius trueperi]OWZ83879.1 glycine/betaine ABC transporter [Natranaerobius trueperi]
MFKKLTVGLALLIFTQFIGVGCQPEGDQTIPERFDNEIIGIDAGAELMDTVEYEVMDVYDLDEYELIDSSEPAMIAQIESAVESEEWIVGIGWTPHWKFQKFGLKFLDDPENTFGDDENIEALGRMGLSNDMPEVTELLENYYLTDEELGELMQLVEDPGDSEREKIIGWAEENQETIHEWIPEDTDGKGEIVKLLYNNWTDAIATTNLIAYVLEQEMNYEVEMKMVDVAFVFQGLVSGDFDAMVCAWLPLTQASYWETYGDGLENYGPLYEGAELGLVVPDYVEVDSIEEMSE